MEKTSNNTVPYFATKNLREIIQYYFPYLKPLQVDDVLSLVDNVDLQSALSICLSGSLETETSIATKNHWLNSFKDYFQFEKRKVMILLRGLPGSGKSTLAEVLRSAAVFVGGTGSAVVCSADDYFYDSQTKDGVYRYVSDDVGRAHEFCQEKVKQAMESQVNLVIVDNTHTQIWEMLPYVRMASYPSNYFLMIMSPNTPWAKDTNILSLKTIHDIPVEKIYKMKQRFEPHTARAANVVSSIPIHLRPVVITLDDIIASSADQNGGSSLFLKKSLSQESDNIWNKSDSELNVTPELLETEGQSECTDLECLSQFFPHISSSELRQMFEIECNRDLNLTINLILSQEQQDQPICESLNLVLSSQEADCLEKMFGAVVTEDIIDSMRGQGFTTSGLLEFTIPPDLAFELYECWRIQTQEKLSRAVALNLAVKNKELDFASEGAFPPLEHSSDIVASGKDVLNGTSMISSPPEINSAPFRTLEKELMIPAKYVDWNQNKMFSHLQLTDEKEIINLRRERENLYRKAAQAHRSKQGAVAGHYAEQARVLKEQIEKFKYNNRHISFAKANPNRDSLSLDLHGLWVNEAVEALDAFLGAKLSSKMATGQKTRLEIITGHSGAGQYMPKIKKAVEKELSRRGLTWCEANLGCLHIL